MIDDGTPVAYTALVKGTPVTSQSGSRFGTVDQVLDDPKCGIFHGIVVATTKGPRLVARGSIERITTAHVICSLTDQQVNDLPPAPPPQAVKTRSRFLRRA